MSSPEAELADLRQRLADYAVELREWVAATSGKPGSSDDICEVVSDFADEIERRFAQRAIIRIAEPVFAYGERVSSNDSLETIIREG